MKPKIEYHFLYIQPLEQTITKMTPQGIKNTHKNTPPYLRNYKDVYVSKKINKIN